MSKISENIIGKKFGRLTVISKQRGYYYECKCDCGTIKNVYFYSLIKGVSKSCGCLLKEIITKHGMHGSLTYRSWDHMIQRCTNRNKSYFKNYSGRGITVCERWHDFENFLADMGERPSKKYSIERIDNSKGYSLENCKWATKEEQQNNTRWNHILEFNGQHMSISQWAKKLGINHEALRSRLRKNWSIERALTTKTNFQ